MSTRPIERQRWGRLAAAVRTTGARSRYERGPEIARGGLGRVMTALDRTLQRPVAIKELHHPSQRGARRFVRESLTTARLQHPSIVPVLDAGTSELGDPYLVMKLLEGQTLSDAMRTRTTTEARLALLPNLLAVADALGYAHERGVVHRDVKPANIMIGTHGETMLLDWGIAHDPSATELETDGLGRGIEPRNRASEEPLTVAGMVAGTFQFMSPEQARGEPPTPGFDVYSLGATIATVLAGELPFGGLEHDAILDSLRAGKSSIPSLPADISEDLVAIIEKATAAPSQRYAHAGLLANDLRKFIAGQLVSARRYTLRQLAARWIRKHRVLVGIAGAALAAVVVVAAIAYVAVVHERDHALARADDLILLQARASLRTDPTSAIAWLETYPETSPHQDEVLALADEAAGRGVARHLWQPADTIADLVFADDGRALVMALSDGQLLRGDLDTGDLHLIARLGAPPLFVNARGRALAVLDRDGWLYQGTAADLARTTQLRLPARPTGLFFTNDPSVLKVAFIDRDAMYAPASAHSIPNDEVFTEDENDASAIYALSAAGELSILDPAPRRLWTFAPETWVRSSDDGAAYAAISPGPDGVRTVWTGTAAGAPPVEVGTTRACAVGEDREQSSEVANDASVVVLKRCGVLLVYNVRDRQPIAIENPDQVGAFELSPDARWLALGRSSATELLDLQTGLSRRLAGASTISKLRFSSDSRWLASVGPEQGVRVWLLEPVSNATRLADAITPVRLLPSSRPDELAVRRHLDCAVWSTTGRRIVTSREAPPSSVRNLDDERLLWAWDSSADGRTCIFAGRDDTALVVRADGTTRVLATPRGLASCVLSSDGAAAFCSSNDDTLITLDVATGTSTGARRAAGTVRALVRYRDHPVVLVRTANACRLETFAGDVIASLPGQADCTSARVSAGGGLRGHEAGLVIGRAGAVDIWTDRTVEIAGEHSVVAVAATGERVAIAEDRTVSIENLRTRSMTLAPLRNAFSVRLLAWSSTGTLASADDETVRLWDTNTRRTSVLDVPHALAMAWSDDGNTLFTTNGRVIEAWSVAHDRGESVAALRARLAQLTSAHIVNGRAITRGTP